MNKEDSLKVIDGLIHYAEVLEESFKGRKEEEFYSGMIHGFDLLKEFIKRNIETS